MQTPIYQTATKIMVSSSPNALTSNPYAIYSDQQLAQTYVQLLTTQPMLDGVAKSLGYPIYREGITVQQIQQSSQIIRITVENADPQKAADIANQLVQVLIEQNEILQAGRYAASDETLRVQIEQVEGQIAKYQTDLDNVSTKSVSEQLALVTEQMKPLQAEVVQLQKEIALLLPTTSQQRKAEVAEKQAALWGEAVTGYFCVASLSARTSGGRSLTLSAKLVASFTRRSTSERSFSRTSERRGFAKATANAR